MVVRRHRTVLLRHTFRSFLLYSSLALLVFSFFLSFYFAVSRKEEHLADANRSLSRNEVKSVLLRSVRVIDEDSVRLALLSPVIC